MEGLVENQVVGLRWCADEEYDAEFCFFQRN